MQSKLAKCLCNTCGQYWPSEAAKKRHSKCHGKSTSKDDRLDDYNVFNEVSDEFCIVQFDGEEEQEPYKMPVVNLTKQLVSPFELVDSISM